MLLSFSIVIEVVVTDKVIFITSGLWKNVSFTLKWFLLINSHMWLLQLSIIKELYAPISWNNKSSVVLVLINC